MWRTPRSTRPLLMTAGAALLAGGCTLPILLLQQPTGESQLAPEELVDRAVVVFGRHGIPVEHTNMVDRVESGAFQVQSLWAGVPVEQRVECGTLHNGEPAARTGRVELEIRFRARRRGDMTRAYVDGDGEIIAAVDEDAVGRRCRLTAEFGDELLREILGLPSARTG